MWVLQLSNPEQCLALPNSGSPGKESELGLGGDGAGEVTALERQRCLPLLGWPGAAAGGDVEPLPEQLRRFLLLRRLKTRSKQNR